MITFRLRLPCRTILRVFSRNPLVRGTDRLEAVVMLLAVTVSLLTIPFAAAAGTAVHVNRPGMSGSMSAESGERQLC